MEVTLYPENEDHKGIIYIVLRDIDMYLHNVAHANVMFGMKSRTAITNQ